MKDFIVIGNLNAVTYKDIFTLIKNNQLWLGQNAKGGSRKGNSLSFVGYDGVTKDISSWWFSNVENDRHNTPLDLYKRYSNEYKHYDNYDAIEVGKSHDIPIDYDGVMGVPISFLMFHCPEQFEIVGIDSTDFAEEIGIQPMGAEFIKRYREHGGTGHYTEGMRNLCYYEQDGTPKKVYSRILIRKRNEK